MKKVIKLFSLVLVMIVVLTGCKTKGTKEEINEAIDKTENLNGYITKYGYAYEVDGDNYTYTVDSYTEKDKEMIVNELEIKNDNTISGVKKFTGYGAYEEIVDGVTTRYSYQDNIWNKKEIPTVNFFSSLKKLISNSEIESVETYSEDIKGKIFYMSTESKYINDYLNDSNVVSNSESIETNITKYTIILNEEGYLYSIQIMNGNLKFINVNNEEVNGNMKFNNVYFEELYKNKNSNDAVSIPQEVKDATIQNDNVVTDTTNNTPVTNATNTTTSNVTNN